MMPLRSFRWIYSAPFRRYRKFYQFPLAANTHRNADSHRSLSRYPKTTASAPIPNEIARATHLSEQNYRELIDVYFKAVIEYSGYAQEQGSNIKVGRLNNVITIAAPKTGSFLLTGESHSRRVLLSSPISGSKAFDWVVPGQEQYIDNGSTMGEWLCLEDGVNLSTILNAELGMEMEMQFG
ncbi:hypothetical protein BJ875DRAFT_150653 [Amylocarpus encephaloides]|uniref:Uncharacterized protein n=1 Tax=Amylocarpus encephaloides TaxID=45428 RepID=A0A9P8C1R3_9HELO|nr:hypothetical protein BJ875DRAFT_150653 [Amylocarpus encephaloides]